MFGGDKSGIPLCARPANNAIVAVMAAYDDNPWDRRRFLTGLVPLAAGMAAGAMGARTAPGGGSTAPASGELLIAARRAMACRFAVHFPAEHGRAGLLAASRALDIVDIAEQRLSIYRHSSEVAFVNRWATRAPCVVSAELYALLERSRVLWEATGGAFDIAAGALIRCWKTHLKRGELPPPALVGQLRSASGMDQVELAEQTVRFGHPLLQLDFGSNGKGYALDGAAAMLRAEGLCNALLHGGHSSVYALGAPPWEAGWRVAVRHPLDPTRNLATVLLCDGALAVSADYEQGVAIDGLRYGHHLDPRSGYPAAGVAGAAVLAPTAEAADALSTAFFALGSAGARAYCERDARIGALLVERPAPDAPPRARVLGTMAAALETLELETFDAEVS